MMSSLQPRAEAQETHMVGPIGGPIDGEGSIYSSSSLLLLLLLDFV